MPYAILLAIYFATIAFGFGPYILDDHVFRQTQTALTSRHFTGLGDFLYYQTPVFGPPWSIPFEFPIYQAFAKALHVVSGLTLETSGRVVSIVFFLACFWPIDRILDLLNIEHKPVAVSLILLTPLYLFWSRAFMMETTALFFSLLYLVVFLRILGKDRLELLEAAALLIVGVMAALSKITTFAPLFLVTNLLLAYQFCCWLVARVIERRLIAIGVTQLAIFVVAVLWVEHSDALRSLNALGATQTSDQLRDWIFGPLSQRIDPYIWFALANKVTDIYFPFPLAWR